MACHRMGLLVQHLYPHSPPWRSVIATTVKFSSLTKQQQQQRKIKTSRVLMFFYVDKNKLKVSS